MGLIKHSLLLHATIKKLHKNIKLNTLGVLIKDSVRVNDYKQVCLVWVKKWTKCSWRPKGSLRTKHFKFTNLKFCQGELTNETENVQLDPKNINSRKEISPGNSHKRNNHHHQDTWPNWNYICGTVQEPQIHAYSSMCMLVCDTKWFKSRKKWEDFLSFYSHSKYHLEQAGLGTTKKTLGNT